MLAQLVEDVSPDVAVLDGISSLTHGPTALEVTMMVARQVDLLKSRGITTMATSIIYDDETSAVGVSSLVDTWMLLRNVEHDGERNRLLFLIKSRGTAHSNQVREFILTDHGAQLVDVYIGSEGVLTGSARVVQEAREREAAEKRSEDAGRHRRELQRAVAEGEVRLATLQEEITDHAAELALLDARVQRHGREAVTDREAMAAQRWADPTSGGGDA
jgi:circadian clock protein KaiC